MRSIDRPVDDAGVVFAACAIRTQELPRRAALLAQRPYVEARAVLYLNRANEGRLYQLDPLDPVNIAAAELSGLYKRVLVNGGERPLYARLRGGSRFNLCPLCGQRDVKTLDHYLSKDEFPELAVYPANLIPSCSECNHAKLTYRAEEPGEQLFHPYFDDWSQYQLLYAATNVADDAIVNVSYMIQNPPNCDAQTVERAQRHFAKLELDDLYQQHAAVELVQRKEIFRSIFNADGAEGLRAELDYEARSRRRFNLNCWQSALYQALSESTPFCDGGFEWIEES